MAQRLPRYPLVPAALLGRLAVDLAWRGRRLGELLLADALRRVLDVEPNLEIMAVVVDALDEQAIRFYEHFEFRRFAETRQLYLPMHIIRDIFP